MQDSFQQYIDTDKTQVFVCICPVSIPFSFASHTWFVVNDHGSISRWEVLFRKVPCKTRWGHLFKDYFPPFQGIDLFIFIHRYFWKGTLLGIVEGETAEHMAEFIENSPNTYPYYDTYSLTGPNSNTYTQWVINHFPEISLKLPWNSFGKNYTIE